MKINQEILKTIKYFSIFAYHPTSEEIYTFLQAEISENSFKNELKKMSNRKEIILTKPLISGEAKYTLGEYSTKSKRSNIRYQISKKKLDNWRYMTYVKLLSLFPQIKLIGLSGSISMMNAKVADDIDLFIITAKDRLFTGRLIALFLAQILGLRRKREAQISVFSTASPQGASRRLSQKQKSSPYVNKICLNLFFDERELNIPIIKQTLFVGHEVLQMKPIINKKETYERFLEANKWVFKIFPNAREISNFNFSTTIRSGSKNINTKLGDRGEQELKKLQMRSINKHKTTEIITNTQLWFHPDDFEKKLKKLDLH